MTTISAIIATFNRANVLRDALARLATQSRVPDEIIVVDDASTDDTPVVVRTEFPHVRYIRLPQNMGVAFARNMAVANSTGDYLMFLDDDSWFRDRDGLEKALAFIGPRDDVGAVLMNIQEPTQQLFPSDDEPLDVGGYVDCGTLFRREALEKAGPYVPVFRWGGVEPDRSVRLFGAGYRIVGLPRVAITHQLTMKTRNLSRNRYLAHRNALLRECLRSPAWLLPYRFLRVWAGQARFNLRHGHFLTDLHVLVSLPVIFFNGFRYRAPVSTRAYRAWWRLFRQRRSYPLDKSSV